ncbi:MAG: ABC transporter permease subunit [Candidatus Sungbacteria bacterium]|nr:ABC transporter permease subunit [Candidatus Sungbacteria bacterium]
MRHMIARKRVVIYQSRRHLLAVVLFLLAPFLFLTFFSQIAHIAVSRLYSDLGISMFRLIGAYVIALILGWTLAIGFYKGKRSMVALPVFDVLQSFPTFAILPLASAAFGATNTNVIFFLVLTILWPVFFSILSSLKLMRHDWEEAVEMAGWRGFEYVKRFLWPISVPGLITGSIIGLGEGWGALVATEIIVGVRMGLGDFFSSYSHNASITFFGILGLLTLIFSINKLVWTPLLDWSHRITEE